MSNNEEQSITATKVKRRGRSVRKTADSIREKFKESQLNDNQSNDDNSVNAQLQANNSLPSGPVIESEYTVERVMLGYVQPNENNERDILILNEAQYKKGNSGIFFDKGVYYSNYEKGTKDYNKAELEVAEILALAKQLETQDLINPITLWQRSSSNFPIIAGHRRYCAVVYNLGRSASIRCKVYSEEPEHIATLRFIENKSRKDLPPAGTIKSFNNSYAELLQSNTIKKSDYHEVIGIHQTTFFRYVLIVRYLPKVLKIIETNNISLKNMALVLSSIKKQPEDVQDHIIVKTFERCSKSTFTDIKPTLTKWFDELNDKSADVQKIVTKGRKKSVFTLPKIKISQSNSLKSILTQDVTKIDCGVDWDTLDFADPDSIKEALEKLLNHFEK